MLCSHGWLFHHPWVIEKAHKRKSNHLKKNTGGELLSESLVSNKNLLREAAASDIVQNSLDKLCLSSAVDFECVIQLIQMKGINING